jgi:ferritin-like metal-binding protein YciE
LVNTKAYLRFQFLTITHAKKNINFNGLYLYTFITFYLKLITMEAPHHITDDVTLREVFIHNLSRMYYGKKYLCEHLPKVIEVASFKALKLAIQELCDDVEKQTARLGRIYDLIDAAPTEESCVPLIAIFKEAFELTHGKSKLCIINDMDVILYMQLIEHVNITAYRMLTAIASSLDNPGAEQLLIECFDESKENDKLFELISQEYLAQ